MKQITITSAFNPKIKIKAGRMLGRKRHAD